MRNNANAGLFLENLSSPISGSKVTLRAICCIFLSLSVLSLHVPVCLSFQVSSWGPLHQHCRLFPVAKNKKLVRVAPKSNALSSSDDDNGEIKSTENDKQQQQLTTAYKLTTALFGVISVVLFALPDKTLTKKLASKWGGAAGFGLASYSSHILMGANQNSRLSSDTYRRLNIGLLGFYCIGLVAVPGEAAFSPLATPAIFTSFSMTIVRIVGAVVSYCGWKFGALPSSLSLTSVTNELWQGYKSNWKGLQVLDRKKSLFYRNSLLVLLFGMFSNFMEGISHIRYKEALTKTTFDISLQWSGVARLFLISSIVYSLKDAADRDRLSGTTFIEMNFMVSAWALLVFIAQCIVPFGFDLRNGEFLAFSILFFIKGFRGQKEKREKKQATENP